MKASLCEEAPIEERNGELFIRVPATSIRGSGFCWLPGEAISPVKKRMDEEGKVKRNTAFLIARVGQSDAIYPCRCFITLPGGDMAATLGPALAANTVSG